MSGSLKNYSKYMVSLHRYARAAKIRIRFEDGDFGGGEYDVHTRIIRIDPEEPPAIRVAVLLHELGHAFDEVIMDRAYNKSLARAYNKFYKESHTEYQKSLVLQCELRAWKYGRGLAKLLKIPLGRWYYECKNNSIRSYRK